MAMGDFRLPGLQSVNASERNSNETETAMQFEKSLNLARPYLGTENVDSCLKHMARSTQLAKESMLEAAKAMVAVKQSKSERWTSTGGDKFKKEICKAGHLSVREHVLWRTAGFKVGLLDRDPMEAAWQICDNEVHFDENGISQLHNARLRNLEGMVKAHKQKMQDRADEEKLFEVELKPGEVEGWICIPEPQYIEFDCAWLIEGTTTTTTTVTTTTVHPRRER
jgi:hypothetical protein